MAYTLADLVQELSYRKHDIILATPSYPGTTTTFVSSDLLQHMPSSIAKFNGWIYGSRTADSGNVGLERLATTWDVATLTLTLPAGMPVPMTSGVYEIHRKSTHRLKVKAINTAIRLLALYWYRPIRDESITTVANTYRYTLPNTIDWAEEGPIRVQVQVITAATVTGYPFMDATRWNPIIEREVSDLGVETYFLRFGIQPPPGRLLRVYAPAGYDVLSETGDQQADGDILPLAGQWGGMAFEYIMDKASLQLDNWSLDQAANNEDTQRSLAIQTSRLEKLREQLLRTAQGHQNTLITVPGQRDGMLPARPSDLSHLAAFHTPGP